MCYFRKESAIKAKIRVSKISLMCKCKKGAETGQNKYLTHWTIHLNTFEKFLCNEWLYSDTEYYWPESEAEAIMFRSSQTND